MDVWGSRAAAAAAVARDDDDGRALYQPPTAAAKTASTSHSDALGRLKDSHELLLRLLRGRNSMTAAVERRPVQFLLCPLPARAAVEAAKTGEYRRRAATRQRGSASSDVER